jgi:putative lipoic acid-binding regulatory protein
MPDHTAEPGEQTAAAATAAAAPTASDAPTASAPTLSDQDPLRGAKLQYPVSFELRIIYLASMVDALRTQVSDIMQTYGIFAGAPRLLPVSGKKYGRMAIQVTFNDEPGMHGVYAAIGALPAVKAVM